MEKPEQRQYPRRRIDNERGNALTRQPGGAPLGEGAPGALGAAQVKGGGKQAEGDRAEGEAERDPDEPAALGEEGRAGQEPDQEQQAVAGARSGGEEDDG